MKHAWWIPILLLLAGCQSVPGSSEVAKPNIVLILTDDAGYADFGFTGCPDFTTPNIDRIATEGVTCTDGYVTASVCCPSRAGLMTGRYQQRFGHEVNLLAGTPQYATQGLPQEETTVADRLQELGYATCALGKWHLGVAEGYHPMDRGFDEYYGCLAGSRSYWPYEEPPKHGKGLMRNREPLGKEAEGTYFTDLLTDEAVDFIDRHADEPFFLFVSYTAVHTPMHAREDLLEQHAEIESERRRKLAAMTTSLDDGVGRILDALQEQGIDENTLVIFVNDNGGATNNASDNGIYRGMKGSKWEGGIRIPYAFRWPARLPAGGSFEHPVSTLDILPTAVSAAGGDIRFQDAIDGVDLEPYLAGDETGVPHDRLFWRRSVASAMREGDWKLIKVKGNPVLLFNLADDPSETNNLAEVYPDRVASMSAHLETWDAQLAEPRWGHAKRYREYQVLKHRMEVQGRDAERKLP